MGISAERLQRILELMEKTAGMAAPIDEEGIGMLKELFALLRAGHWNAWTLHWQSKGNSFYGDHTMLERIYNGYVEEIDGLAEKIAGLTGDRNVEAVESMSMALQYVQQWGQEPDLIKRGLMAEKNLQEAIQNVFDSLEQKGQLSMGLNDFLMGLANDHQTNEYLLQQRLTEAGQA